MKYSFMSFSCPELTLDEMIRVAEKYGYQGIEPRTEANHKHGLEFDSSAQFRAQSRQKIAESKIVFSCLATSCRYADPKTNASMIETTHQAIDLAGDIGAPRIRVFGGPMGAGLSRENAQELVANALSAVADHAAEREVILTCETHDDWCDPKDWVPIMQAIHHPAIAINWDIMHPVRVANYTIDESFSALEPWIKHVHFHDGIILENGGVELKPIGTGIVDHKRTVELLQKNGYSDFLSGEWINWTSYEKHLPHELAAMKNYEK